MADTDIVITEIMYDADNAVHDNNHEWVEIANTGTDPVSLNGWTLDDSNTANTGVGTFPDVTLAPGAIAIFYNDNITEADFIAHYNPAPGTVLIPVAGWQPLNNAGGDTVQLFNAGGDLIETITYPDDAGPGQSLNYTPDGVYEGAGEPDPGVICFTSGSIIATEFGEIPIKNLRSGALVQTRDHGLRKLRWIGRRVVSCDEQAQNPAFRPVFIRQSAFKPGVPARDTLISQQHRILLEDTYTEILFGEPRALCAAVALVNGHSIVVQPPSTPVEYIHLLFDRHEVLFVDGLASESFHPSSAGLENLSTSARDEVFALFPELAYGTSIPLAYPALTRAEAQLLGR